MPSSKKTTLWFAVNMALGCLVEVAQYIKAIFEVAENKPEEIIHRLDQIIEVLPACMNLTSQKFTEEELKLAGVNVPTYGQTSSQSTPVESSADTFTGVGSENHLTQLKEIASTSAT